MKVMLFNGLQAEFTSKRFGDDILKEALENSRSVQEILDEGCPKNPYPEDVVIDKDGFAKWENDLEITHKELPMPWRLV